MYAQWRVGQLFLFGKGIPKDWSKAAGWLQKAANAELEKGKPSYAYDLGRLYATGDFDIGWNSHKAWVVGDHAPVAQTDMRRAEFWLDKAAKLGDERAEHWFWAVNHQGMIQIDAIYEMANYVEDRDPSHAYPWLRAACRQGHIEAWRRLIMFFWDASPTYTGNWTERVNWYHFGRKLGHPHARITLKPSFKFIDVELVQRKAAMGIVGSQIVLGQYNAGIGTPQHVVALAWLSAAFEALEDEPKRQFSKKPSSEYLELAKATMWYLKRILSEDELSRAQDLTAEIKTRSPPRQIGILRHLLSTFVVKSGGRK